GVAFGQSLQTARRLELGPLRAQRRDRIALFTHVVAQLHDPLGADGRHHLDPVNVAGAEHEDADDEDMHETHQPLLITSTSVGQEWRSALSAWGGSAVRCAARSFADRARGLTAISCASATTGRRVRISKLGAGCARSGWCREPRTALPRTVRNALTIRSS